ncbi:hypothetical protein [Coleofasciculus sp.]
MPQRYQENQPLHLDFPPMQALHAYRRPHLCFFPIKQNQVTDV